MTHDPWLSALTPAILGAALLASVSLAQSHRSGSNADLTKSEVQFMFAVSAMNHALSQTSQEPEKARERSDEVIAELEKATENGSDDAYAHLLLGLAHCFRGDPAKAAAAFKQARESKAPTGLLELAASASCSLEDGDREEAVRRLQEVVDQSSERVWDHLDFDRVPLLSGQWGVGISTDSNPNLLDDELSLLTPDRSLVNGNDSDQVTHLDLHFASRPLYERAGWTLGLVLGGRRSHHNSRDYLDFGTARVGALLAHGTSPLGYLAGPLGYTRVRVGASRLSWLLQAGGEYLWLGSSSYRRTLTAGASVVVFPTQVTATQADLLYQDRAYFESDFVDSRRSGEVWSLKLNQTFFFNASDRFLRVGVLLADSRAGRPFAASLLEPGLEANLPLGRLWNLYLETARGDEDYDHPESDLFNPSPEPSTVAREDSTWRTSAVLGRRLSERLSLSLHATYRHRESRPRQSLSLDYQRFRAGVHLGVLFGGAQ